MEPQSNICNKCKTADEVYNETLWIIQYQATSKRNTMMTVKEIIGRQWYFEGGAQPYERRMRRTKLTVIYPMDGTPMTWEVTSQNDANPAARCRSNRQTIILSYGRTINPDSGRLAITTLNHLWQYARSIHREGHAWLEQRPRTQGTEYAIIIAFGEYRPLLNLNAKLAHAKLNRTGPSNEWRTDHPMAAVIARQATAIHSARHPPRTPDEAANANSNQAASGH